MSCNAGNVVVVVIGTVVEVTETGMVVVVTGTVVEVVEAGIVVVLPFVCSNVVVVVVIGWPIIVVVVVLANVGNVVVVGSFVIFKWLGIVVVEVVPEFPLEGIAVLGSTGIGDTTGWSLSSDGPVILPLETPQPARMLANNKARNNTPILILFSINLSSYIYIRKTV